MSTCRLTHDEVMELCTHHIEKRFVTASLKVDYLKPTPLGPELEARGRVKERSERKAIVEVTLWLNGVVTPKGDVVAVAMPGTMDRS